MYRNAFKVMQTKYKRDLETWTGHLSVCTIRKYYNGWALGCQPPNFDPQINTKWHNSVKNV